MHVLLHFVSEVARVSFPLLFYYTTLIRNQYKNIGIRSLLMMFVFIASHHFTLVPSSCEFNAEWFDEIKAIRSIPLQVSEGTLCLSRPVVSPPVCIWIACLERFLKTGEGATTLVAPSLAQVNIKRVRSNSSLPKKKTLLYCFEVTTSFPLMVMVPVAGPNHRSAQVLLLLVIPGQLIFLIAIHLMQGGDTLPSALLTVAFLSASLIQVSQSHQLHKPPFFHFAELCS